jgi:hypothetical protein
LFQSFERRKKCCQGEIFLKWMLNPRWRFSHLKIRKMFFTNKFFAKFFHATIMEYGVWSMEYGAKSFLKIQNGRQIKMTDFFSLVSNIRVVL